MVLIPVSSTPVVVGGLDEDSVNGGLLDDGGHDSHLLVGGLVVAVISGGDGDQACFYFPLQREHSKMLRLPVEELN